MADCYPFYNDPWQWQDDRQRSRRRALEAERQRRRRAEETRRQRELYDAILAEQIRRQEAEERERARRVDRRREEERRRLEAEEMRQRAAIEAKRKKELAAIEAQRRREENLERRRQRDAERGAAARRGGAYRWWPYGESPSWVQGPDGTLRMLGPTYGAVPDAEAREPATSTSAQHESHRSWPHAFPDGVFRGLSHLPFGSVRGWYNDGVPESYRDPSPPTPPPTRSTSASEEDDGDQETQEKEEEISQRFRWVRHPTQGDDRQLAEEYRADIDAARLDPPERPTRPSPTVSVEEASDDDDGGVVRDEERARATYAASLRPGEGSWMEPNEAYDSWAALRRQVARDGRRTCTMRRKSV